MAKTLIYTERRFLPKLLDGLLTLLAWAGFIWLIYYGLAKVLEVHPNIGPRPVGLALGTIAIYLLVAVFNTAILIIWAKYNQKRFKVERRNRREPMSDGELIGHFSVDPGLYQKMQQAKVSVINHCGKGKVCDVVVNSYSG